MGNRWGELIDGRLEGERKRREANEMEETIKQKNNNIEAEEAVKIR